MATKFCLLTHGRTGSTSLMRALEHFGDVAVPNKNITCVDNELLHPARVEAYMARYSRLVVAPIATTEKLVEAFFDYNNGAAYVGFKSMPRRHADYNDFIKRADIQFITLVRRDIPSVIASLILAESTGCWRRAGEPQHLRWHFSRTADAEKVMTLFVHIKRSRGLLRQVPKAIRLTYEELCDPAFSSTELNEFFGRSVRLPDPLPPTCARDYVLNWEEFLEFVRTDCAGGARPAQTP